MSKTTQNTFMKLYKTDVSKYIEKKGQLITCLGLLQCRNLNVPVQMQDGE